jgi:hypothetical protein
MRHFVSFVRFVAFAPVIVIAKGGRVRFAGGSHDHPRGGRLCPTGDAMAGRPPR